ncbi:tetrameric acyl-CoA thioesterase, partial [Pseudomonas aeruginosa]
VRERTAGGEKYLPRLHAEVRDDAGTLVARVQKTLYVRLKPRLRNAA